MPATTEQIAAALVQARRSRSAVPALLPGDAAAAYAVQRAVAETLGWFADRTPVHWKSGAGSRTATPTHAALPPAGVLHSPADGRALPLRSRGIEAEVALKLGAPIDAAQAAALDVDAARALVSALCVSIEVVDFRWSEGNAAPPLAKLADLQSHGALVLGDWVPFVARDWSSQRCSVQIGDAPAREFTGTHALGDPCQVLPAFLKHATAHLGRLPGGTIVTTGTWCGLLDAAAGDRVHVAFDGIGVAELLL